MEDYSIMQGQTLLEVTFALLSVLIVSYVYISWRSNAHTKTAAQSKPEVGRPNMLGQLSTDPRPSSSPPSPPLLWWEKEKPSIGDWVAPILAWAAVILITLALMGALLGEG